MTDTPHEHQWKERSQDQLDDEYRTTGALIGRWYCVAPDCYDETDEATLRAAAIKTRDRLAFFLWSEDDSGDDNDLIAAYDELRDLLGPSTEESVAETLRAALQQPAVQSEEPHDD